MSSKINTGNGEGLSAVSLEDSCSLLDELMITACGHELLYCTEVEEGSQIRWG